MLSNMGNRGFNNTAFIGLRLIVVNRLVRAAIFMGTERKAAGNK